MTEWLPAAALLVLCASCRNDWRTDMWFEAAVQPQEAPARAEPEHSVRLDARPPIADRDDATDLPNPVAAGGESVRHGALIFQARCACCHGDGGRGDGPVSKLFPQATDLASEPVRRRSDGYLFGTVTFGGRAMPEYADGLTRRDRWDVVNFVRSLQAGSR